MKGLYTPVGAVAAVIKVRAPKTFQMNMLGYFQEIDPIKPQR